MRNVAPIIAIVLAIPSPAWAAEIRATSRIDAVTVYPSGGEITRVTRVKLDRGEHTIVFADLPAQAIPASIRAEAKASGRLEIGSVDNRRVFVPRGDESAQASERIQTESDIERLKDERAGLEAVIQAAEAQKTFVNNLAGLPTVGHQAGAPGAGGQQDWGQVFSAIGTQFASAQLRVLESGVKIRELDRRIADLGRRLAGLAPRRDERTEVKVHVSSAAALEADVIIRYQVPQASWTPHYDARLETGARNVAPKLTLVRRASIQQRSGEAWQNALITLSTVRPAAGTSAPELRPLTVDIQQEPPRPAPVAAAPQVMRRSMQAADESREKVSPPPPPAAAMIAAEEVAAAVDVGAFQASFLIKDRLNVPETGESKRILVDEQVAEPSLTVRAVPRLDARAFLYAKVMVPRTSPYLPGPLSLFRDQTFVGMGRLPQLAPGEDHELGFGADDLVRVRYSVVDEKRGESGLITSSRTDQRTYRIVIKNQHERPIAYSVQDQVPVSNNQDIKVDLTGRTPPSRRDIDDKRGVLAWDDKLNPDEERIIEFGYRVIWPVSKTITYNR